MITLLPHLKQHFDHLQDRLLCFCRAGVQVEGWFKGEMLFLLEEMAARSEIDAFDREVKRPGRTMDLYLTIARQPHWVELKHWLIGYQRRDYWSPNDYFGDRSSVGINPDVEKLKALDASGERWLLILMTANPGPQAWQSGLDKFHAKFAPRELRSHSDPADFPDSYFLGLLEVV
jgi:hypothetical protein